MGLGAVSSDQYQNVCCDEKIHIRVKKHTNPVRVFDERCPSSSPCLYEKFLSREYFLLKIMQSVKSSLQRLHMRIFETRNHTRADIVIP